MTGAELSHIVTLLAERFKAERTLPPVIRFAGQDYDVAPLLERAGLLDDVAAQVSAVEALGLPPSSPVSLAARLLRERARWADEERNSVTTAVEDLDSFDVAAIADTYLANHR